MKMFQFAVFTLLSSFLHGALGLHLLERNRTGGHDHCPGIRSEKLVEQLMQNYSRSVAPSNPVAVQVETTFQDINELSVMSNAFRADLWFSAIWHDPRLSFAHLDPCRLNISFDESFERYLWSPNVCLVNTKLSRVHVSPKPNVLLMILANGTVWLNYRVQVEAPCEFHLSDFPMDSALCSLVFESYSYNTATVTINWMTPNAVTLLFDKITASDYQLTHSRHFKHTEYYKAGEWYRLTVQLGFRRQYGYYILQVYANMYINVFLSWIAFCISLKALPARVILSVNTLMSMCLQFGNIVSSLPPVSYIKSIDVFMFACIAFIFASLLEMAFIAYKDKKMMLRSLRFSVGVGSLFNLAYLNNTLAQSAAELGGSVSGISSGLRQHSVPQQHQDGDLGSCLSSEAGIQSDGMHLGFDAYEDEHVPRVPNYIMRRILRKRRRDFLERGHRIDQISFLLFPLTFSLFNAIYWTYYLSKRAGRDD